MTINDLAVVSLQRSAQFFHGFVDDLSPEDFKHVHAPGANAPAWIVAHLLAVEYMMLGLLTQDRPALPEGFDPQRFGRGSAYDPSADVDPAALLPFFDRLRDRTIEVVRAMPASEFDRKLPNISPRFSTVGELIAVMGVHVALHAGQLSGIRRSLGKPALF
ncbi:MAG: DinB family protein [Tepidisphaeraceae bacterium]